MGGFREGGGWENRGWRNGKGCISTEAAVALPGVPKCLLLQRSRNRNCPSALRGDDWVRVEF